MIPFGSWWQRFDFTRGWICFPGSEVRQYTMTEKQGRTGLLTSRARNSGTKYSPQDRCPITLKARSHGDDGSDCQVFSSVTLAKPREQGTLQKKVQKNIRARAQEGGLQTPSSRHDVAVVLTKLCSRNCLYKICSRL